MSKGKLGKHLRAQDFSVSDDDRPGWTRVNSACPEVGQNVYCAGGEGTVISVHGKTSDGSRLIEIRLRDEKAPFFAAGSNVLLPSELGASADMPSSL
jgi:hypothetical protein